MAKKKQLPFLALLIVALVAVVYVAKSVSMPSVPEEQNEVQITTITDDPATVEETDYFVQPDIPKPDYPEGWEEYVNEEFGYSFAYPPAVTERGFTHKTGIYEYQNMGYVSVEGIDAIGGVEVLEMRLSEAQNSITENRKAAALPRLIVEEKNIAWSGYTGKMITFSDKDKSLMDTVILVEDEGRTYVLVWPESLDRVDELGYNLFGKKILGTFHID